MRGVIDAHLKVPLPLDRFGKASCPVCHFRLTDVKKTPPDRGQRYSRQTHCHLLPLLERLLPQLPQRHGEPGKHQPPVPPGVEIHQPQLVLNALATTALVRLCYRLPFTQIQQLFLDLPALSPRSA